MRAEQERRRRAGILRPQQARYSGDFTKWLSEASPGWPWHYPYLQHIRAQLDRVTAGEIDRLMIFLPPRSFKTEMVTVRYPVYRLEADPTLRIIVGSYNQILANRFSRKSRRLARARFPLSTERQAVEEWETPEGGGYRAAGVGGGVTGGGAHLILIDDPFKSREEAESQAYRDRVWEWYTDDMTTRLEPGPSVVILIQTRWHSDDLAGRILKSEDGPSWTVISLPALAEENDPLGRQVGEALCPERYPVPVLERRRIVLGPAHFAALFQQRPVSDTGEIFQVAWWSGRNRFDPDNAGIRRACVGRWLFFDTALTDTDSACFTGCVEIELCRDYSIMLRRIWEERLIFPDLLNRIERESVDANRDLKLKGVVIEDKVSGISAIQTLRAAAPDWLRGKIVAWPVKGSKEERARVASMWCSRNTVLLPEPSDAVPWLADFENRLYTFPVCDPKDAVDAFTMAIIYLEHYLRQAWRRALRRQFEMEELEERGLI